MHRVQQARIPAGPVVGVLAVAALLGALEWSGDLGAVGWVAGLVCGIGGCALLGRALVRAREADRAVRTERPAHTGPARLTPADRVTLARLVLSCGVAALVAAAFAQGGDAGWPLVLLASVALILDWVDGRVARLTGSVTRLGARFDMETDAFLLLVLSGYVAHAIGWWVLAIGLARYAFVAAGRLLPWLRGTAPARPWCKVVAALQGIVLVVVAADLLPAPAEIGALVVALGLLTESFGREAWQLWLLGQRRQVRARSAAPAPAGSGLLESLATPPAASGQLDA